MGLILLFNFWVLVIGVGLVRFLFPASPWEQGNRRLRIGIVWSLVVASFLFAYLLPGFYLTPWQVQVLDLEGKPVPDALITCQNKIQGADYSRTYRVNADGRATIRLAEQRSFSLQVSSRNFDTLSIRLQANPKGAGWLLNMPLSRRPESKGSSFASVISLLLSKRELTVLLPRRGETTPYPIEMAGPSAEPYPQGMSGWEAWPFMREWLRTSPQHQDTDRIVGNVSSFASELQKTRRELERPVPRNSLRVHSEVSVDFFRIADASFPPNATPEQGIEWIKQQQREIAQMLQPRLETVSPTYTVVSNLDEQAWPFLDRLQIIFPTLEGESKELALRTVERYSGPIDPELFCKLLSSPNKDLALAALRSLQRNRAISGQTALSLLQEVEENEGVPADRSSEWAQAREFLQRKAR